MSNTRRQFLKQSAYFTTLSTFSLSSACQSGHTPPAAVDPGPAKVKWPVLEGPNTPKICTGISRNADVSAMRNMKQIGIDYVLMGGPPIPWDQTELQSIVDRFSTQGLKVINMMIGGFPNVIYGREGRDQEIENVRMSIRAAGTAGIPVVEYNFYAHRLMEGYHEVEGRGGAGYTGFDYAPVKDLPADAEIGEHRAEDLWANLTYFLEAVIPVAEEAGVRMAVHPNDPPIPVSHGSDQILATFDDWKRLVSIVESPANGMTFDCGVTRETGADPVEVCRYLGERDRINHAHFRNVLVDEPYTKYVEVFPDNGLVNMFAVMQELVNLGYSLGIYPEHQRALDYDRNAGTSPYYPGGGGFAGLTYNVAYARAMLQASLTVKAG
jgi:mannonate dehydratase